MRRKNADRRTLAKLKTLKPCQNADQSSRPEQPQIDTAAFCILSFCANDANDPNDANDNQSHDPGAESIHCTIQNARRALFRNAPARWSAAYFVYFSALVGRLLRRIRSAAQGIRVKSMSGAAQARAS